MKKMNNVVVTVALALAMSALNVAGAASTIVKSEIAKIEARMAAERAAADAAKAALAKSKAALAKSKAALAKREAALAKREAAERAKLQAQPKNPTRQGTITGQGVHQVTAHPSTLKKPTTVQMKTATGYQGKKWPTVKTGDAAAQKKANLEVKKPGADVARDTGRGSIVGQGKATFAERQALLKKELKLGGGSTGPITQKRTTSASMKVKQAELEARLVGKGTPSGTGPSRTAPARPANLAADLLKVDVGVAGAAGATSGALKSAAQARQEIVTTGIAPQSVTSQLKKFDTPTAFTTTSGQIIRTAATPSQVAKKVEGLSDAMKRGDYSGKGGGSKPGWSKGKIAAAIGIPLVIGGVILLVLAVTGNLVPDDSDGDGALPPVVPEEEAVAVVTTQNELNDNLDALQEALDHFDTASDIEAESALAILKQVTGKALESARNNNTAVAKVQLTMCKQRCKGSKAKKKKCQKNCTNAYNKTVQAGNQIYDKGMKDLQELGA